MRFEEFVEIMRRLRKECPWDRAQTRQSLRPYLVEETYELLEALDQDDPDSIREELGDLLLQIVFLSSISEERGEFGINDVIEGIGDKMVHRHPHVFGSERFETPEEVVGQWEERKKEEGKMRSSLLSGIPEAMPALLRAQRIQGRAARVGFDWSRAEDVLDKVEEEIGEFREALMSKDASKIEDEMGDVFFSLVNLARFVGVNSEDALRGTIAKFIRRFRHMEMRAAERGVQLSEMSLEEMERYWQEAKD